MRQGLRGQGVQGVRQGLSVLLTPMPRYGGRLVRLVYAVYVGRFVGIGGLKGLYMEFSFGDPRTPRPLERHLKGSESLYLATGVTYIPFPVLESQQLKN